MAPRAFMTGDDVEIHEMSLGLLLHHPWPIWDLRSAVFPLGNASTVTAWVAECVGLAMTRSPAMTRARSQEVAPHRPIHRRIGNQYSTEKVRITNSVGNMRSSGRVRSRRHPLRAAILPLGKEIGEFAADDLRLTEHGMPPDSRLTNRAPGMGRRAGGN